VEAHYPVQRLTLPRKFDELDAATLARIQQEQAVLSRLWETVTPDRRWQGPFRVPLESAAPPNGFGVRRIINGEPRAPHTGADFSAPAGTPVMASNAGTVALVAEQFFSGRTVILDHGLGLYTMYFHLQECLVREGQRVAPGEVIGRVGSTGRATGPHLHWGVRLNGARIDPEALVNLTPLE
jgi:murein DD-endopeptidase MepM/ murein hydrolase activator NlpD